MSTSREKERADLYSFVKDWREAIEGKVAQIPKIDFSELPKMLLEIFPQIEHAIIDENTTARHFDLASSAHEIIFKLLDVIEVIRARQEDMQAADDMGEFLNEYITKLNIGMAEYKTRKETKKSLARSGSAAKLVNDPKQLAKAQIKQEFDAWQCNEVIYSNNPDFAKKMSNKFPISFKTVESWIPIWRKATP